MLTHINETETLKHFSSIAERLSSQQINPAVKLISPRQKKVLFIIAKQKRLTTDGLEHHSRSLFKKSFEELNRVEASDFMKYFNRNIIPNRR